MFKSKEIMPKVMVYRDVFDVDYIMSIVKDTEQRHDSKNITEWRKWLHLGTMANEIGNDRPKSDQIVNNEDPDSFEFKEKEFQRIVRDAYNKVAKDYVSNWKDAEGWPDWIVSWDLNDENWGTDRINILKYDPTQGTNMNAMHYHTDNHEYEHGRGSKWTLTVTMYLNDNYDGGDISFLNEENGEVIDYKPKAGDITVFPSFAPYFHAVKRVDNGNKYLIRMFWHHNYPGTPEWLEQERIYGQEVWAEMEQKRKEDGHKNQIYSKYSKYIVWPGQEEDKNSEYTAFFATQDARRVSNDW